MKKALAVILAALSALCLMGCEKGAPQQKAGGKAIEEFITHIAAGEYAEAYALLSSSCRNDTEEEKANRVTEKQFTDKYTSIISALEITAIEYADFMADGGDILYSASYTATYYSDYIGDVTNNFTAVAVHEGGEWKVEWSPALIFPEMEWGDTVRIARLSAKRGEILSNGEAIAKTAGGISVYLSLIHKTEPTRH